MPDPLASSAHGTPSDTALPRLTEIALSVSIRSEAAISRSNWLGGIGGTLTARNPPI
jgi:hypothetical protein